MRRNWDGSEWTGGEDNWYTDHGDSPGILKIRAVARKRGKCHEAVVKHEGQPIRDIAKATGLAYNSLHQAAKRAGTYHPRHTGKGDGVRRWSRKFDKCQKCGTKKRPYEARGMCVRCYNGQYRKKRLLRDPAFRARRNAENKKWRIANAGKVKEKNEAWHREHPERVRAMVAKGQRLRKAKGYSSEFLDGDFVGLSFCGGVWRIEKRFVLDREAVVNVRAGSKSLCEVPMSSLTLVIERAGKNT